MNAQSFIEKKRAYVLFLESFSCVECNFNNLEVNQKFYIPSRLPFLFPLFYLDFWMSKFASKGKGRYIGGLIKNGV